MVSHKRVTLDYARKHLIPPRPDGKPINPSTLWRWNRKGLAGLDGERIRLDVTYAGNRPMVTANAIDDFFQAITAAKLERYRRTEELAADVTDDELEAAGLRIPARLVREVVSERTDAKSVRGEVAK